MTNTGIRDEIYRVDASDGEFESMARWDNALSSVSYVPELDRFAFTRRMSTSPGDVWVLDAGESSPTQVTHVHDHLTSTFQLPREEAITWHGEDGETVEGLLYYPLGYEAR